MIPECDNPNHTEYTQKWVINAVPYHNDLTPLKCQRYQYRNESESDKLCNINNFDTSQIVGCDNFIYKTDELTIVKEVYMQQIIKKILNITL